jgi:glutamate-1-semialdehyde 2,1-aminomutase
VAAGLATLTLVQTASFYDKLAATAYALCKGLSEAAASHRIPFSAQHVGGMFGLYFRDTPPQTYAEVMQCDKERFNTFFHAMLAQGVYLAPSAYEAGFVSSAHSAADIEKTVAAADKAFTDLQNNI